MIGIIISKKMTVYNRICLLLNTVGNLMHRMLKDQVVKIIPQHIIFSVKMIC